MGDLLFTWIIAASLYFGHPYHVSMTEINHNLTTKTLEISVRIFTDDLEKTIRTMYTGKVDLLNSNERNNSKVLLQQYITEHLVIKANGKPVALNFIGFEPAEGSIWSYLDSRNIASLTTLEVDNSILQNLKEQQVNFIHIKTDNTEQTIRLDYPVSYRKFLLESK